MQRDRKLFVQNLVSGEIDYAFLGGSSYATLYLKFFFNEIRICCQCNSDVLTIIKFFFFLKNAREGKMSTTEKYWVVLGDIHDKVATLPMIPELSAAQGIIVTGDLTNLGSIPEVSQVMQVLRSLKLPVWAQFGNMDRPEVNTWLTQEQCNLHCTVRELLPDTALFGVGASLTTPFRTPSEFAEADYASWLAQCWEKAKRYTHTILIAHNPPYATLCDRISTGVHVGSVAIKEFIEHQQPDMCICGHIHESRAQTLIGRTQVINLGAFAAGYYGLLKVSAAAKFSVELCTLQK